MSGRAGLTTQIYLAAEVVDAGALGERLSLLLGEFALPSILLMPAAGRIDETNALKDLVGALQSKGTAVVMFDDVAAAAATGADGVHLSGDPDADPEAMAADLSERYRNARQRLGNGAIVGVDVIGSRHAAMTLAEMGADYVGFGPDRALPTDAEGEGPMLVDLLSWWSEIFEVPVVALDTDDDAQARTAAEAGADFVMRRLPVGASAADLRDWLMSAIAAIAERPEHEEERA